MAVMMAKLMLFATRTTLAMYLVPPNQGGTHCPEAVPERQDEPGPIVES